MKHNAFFVKEGTDCDNDFFTDNFSRKGLSLSIHDFACIGGSGFLIQSFRALSIKY